MKNLQRERESGSTGRAITLTEKSRLIGTGAAEATAPRQAAESLDGCIGSSALLGRLGEEASQRQQPLLGVGGSWNAGVARGSPVPCGAATSLVLSSPRSRPRLPWGSPVAFWSIMATAVGLPLRTFAICVATPPGRPTLAASPGSPVIAVGIAEALVGECHSGDRHVFRIVHSQRGQLWLVRRLVWLWRVWLGMRRLLLDNRLLHWLYHRLWMRWEGVAH